jgi:hypothetical protein
MRGRLKLFIVLGKQFMEVPRIVEVPGTVTDGLARNLGKLPVWIIAECVYINALLGGIQAAVFGHLLGRFHHEGTTLGTTAGGF